MPKQGNYNLYSLAGVRGCGTEYLNTPYIIIKVYMAQILDCAFAENVLIANSFHYMKVDIVLES